MRKAAAWGVGLEVMCKEGQRQRGSREAWPGTAWYQLRHGPLSPASTSRPWLKATAPGSCVLVLSSNCGAGLREDLGEDYPGSGWNAQGRLCPLSCPLVCPFLSLSLIFIMSSSKLSPGTPSKFGSQCSGGCGEKCSPGSKALRLGTADTTTRLK